MPEARYTMPSSMMWILDELLSQIIAQVDEGYTNVELHVQVSDSTNSRMHRLGVVNRQRTLISRCTLNQHDRDAVRRSLVGLEDAVYNMHYVYEPQEISMVLVVRKRDDVSVSLSDFAIE